MSNMDTISRIAGVALSATRFIIRSISKLFGRDSDLDLWCKVSDFQSWQFGHVREDDQFNTREYWLGPLHLVTSTL